MHNKILLNALARVETQSIYSPAGEEMLVISRKDYEHLLNVIEGADFLIKDERAS